MIAQRDPITTMDLPDPATLEFHRTWKVYLKSNSDEWIKKNFKQVMNISNVKDMWGFLNNVPSAITGQYNIFMMENGLAPLWENHKDLFENGGCWSTIIRGNPWKEAMNEIFMAMVGELHFDEDNVRGLCVVPVSFQHCIVKLWVRRPGQSVAKKLESVMKHLGCCAPRFKPFA
jgi:hypothetical protein